MPKMRLLPTATEFNLTDLLSKVNDPTGTPEVQQGTIAQLKTLLGGGVRVYRALLTQSGTDAPVAAVLENSLGGTVVWTREDEGAYVATLAGAFLANKTFSQITNGGGGGSNALGVARVGDDFVEIFAPADGVVGQASVEILVYP